MATRARNTEMVRALLSAGADYNVRNKDQKTAYQIARALKHEELQDTILAEKAKIAATKRIRLAQHYLINRPLPVEPLIRIFAEYATNQV